MRTAKRYRLVAADPYQEFVLTATGATGSTDTEVYVDPSGAVRAEIDADGEVRSITTALPLGRPVRAEPLD
ncbi:MULTISPECIES: DUF6296 family protein [Kitasatospora]|uniref:DUF6296 family protein n=1 Tax=Kitasatospora cathayae TaxID=3004092 RepID=A0ABY7PVM9_9ACTN|nr:DUF6296 family protein [Kitasatospora sp. HUAS 3-15]WBP84488.1 DUF6296 family protein [Kitasatospora sp. HUAS 3-15]